MEIQFDEKEIETMFTPVYTSLLTLYERLDTIPNEERDNIIWMSNVLDCYMRLDLTIFTPGFTHLLNRLKEEIDRLLNRT